MRLQLVASAALAAFAFHTLTASADVSALLNFSDPSGLKAQAEFTLQDATHLQVRLRDISTGVPSGFSAEDQVITSVSWDFGVLGFDPSDPAITGGTVAIGATSTSVNFSGGVFGPGADVSAEYGFANNGPGGTLANVVSTLAGGVTKMATGNLDGTLALGGPQGGIVSNPPIVALGGLGVIENEILINVTINQPLTDLSFISRNQVRVEFGAAAGFITVPEPGMLAGLGLISACLFRRR